MGTSRRVRSFVVFALVITALLAGSPAGRADSPVPRGGPVTGPDVPSTTPPVATVTALQDARFTFTESPQSATFQVPSVPWNRVVLVFEARPDGDPWDRLFGVSVGGVEVLRGTTPRTAFTLRKDITEFAALLPSGGQATTSLLFSTYVGSQVGTVRFEFYDDPQTASLVASPAASVVPAHLWGRLNGTGTEITAPVTFPASAPAAATVEFTTSGHGDEEFWYQRGQPKFRVLDVMVDEVVIGKVEPLPYVYALLGFSGTVGVAAHPVMWWSAHQALDVGGVHTGNGEIPPYRFEVAPEHLNLLTGGRTVKVLQENGRPTWITSVSVLLR